MPLAAGTRLGAYEIVSPIGAGGMGEVYRARDTKLNRHVAIKILPETFAADHERLARFEREAQTLAALNHPNIATIYGVEGSAIVMELLDGLSLRDELSRSAPPLRKAIEWGVQMANGLAAAHARGIVHRDVKPENVFVTTDGRVKLLDFGIARVPARTEAGATATHLSHIGTEPGVLLGTAGYMSPEQVRGEPIDERSDIFSLGAVLYEVLAGRRPFTGGSTVETMHAILADDPPALDGGTRPVPPILERIVRRCLEKRPDDRFHSAHDVALALEAAIGTGAQTAAIAAVRPEPRRWLLAAAAVVAIAALGVAALSMLPPRRPVLPSFQRLTFNRGTVDVARFIGGSTEALYTAQWQGSSPAVFSVRPQRTESQALGHENSRLLAVSAAQEVALLTSPRYSTGTMMGTLAAGPLGAGIREIATRVSAADYLPGNAGLVYADFTGEGARVYSAGRVIYQWPNTIPLLRCSPKGDRIALSLSPFGSQLQTIRVIDTTGAEKGAVAVVATGLAWSADGSELLFSETNASGETTISAVRPGGAPRAVWRGAGEVALEDVAPDGTILANFRDVQSGVLLQRDGQTAASDVGWSNSSAAADISPSGDALLLNTAMPRSDGSYFIRKLDGSPAIRLGDGYALAWSRDGEQVLAMKTDESYIATPVGPGAPHVLLHPGISANFAWYQPDGTILMNGRRSDGVWRFFVMKPGGEVAPVGPDGLDHWIGQHVPSDDGTLIAAFPSGQNLIGTPSVYSLAGGPPVPIEGFQRNWTIVRFTPDARHLLVYDRDRLPVRIYSLDYRTGERTLWREFAPADPAGITGVRSMVMTPDGRIVAYNYMRSLSTLYLISGLR